MSLPHAIVRTFRTTLAAADGELPANALARIRFGIDAPARSDPREMRVPLPLLGAGCAELWLSDLPVACGEQMGVRYAENGEALFGDVRVAQTGDLTELSQAIYSRIGSFMRTRGYPHFLRAWNYVAGINQGSGDAERYRHFSLGRHRAFAGTRDFEAGLPAGTAIGSGAAELVVLFLAAKYAGAQVENPRQVSAYRYPRQYGPGAPSFARAVLARGQLLVSGTASVVGHASMHRGDVLEQLRETHANLLSLMQCASRRHNLDADAAQPQALRIYLRHRADWQRVQREVQRLFGAAPIIALHGDICRADLDVEIEGVYTLRGGDRA